VSEDLEFGLGLKDEMSGPAHDALSAIRELTKALKENAEAGKSAEGGHKKIGESFEHLGEKAHESEGFFKEFTSSLIPQIAIGELAAEGLKKIGEGLVEGVKFAVEASEFKENMVDAYGAIKGGAEAGEETFKEIDALSTKVHMPAEKAHELAQSLMLQGLTNQETINKSITAVSNLTRVGLEQGADRLRMTIERSVVAGHLEVSKRSLAGTGVSFDALATELAKRTKRSTEEVKQLLKDGRIEAEFGIDAITDTINKGKIGEVAAKKFTLTDAMTDIKNKIRGVFQEANAGPIVDAFKSIADSIQPGSEGAKELKDDIDSLISLTGSIIDLGHTLGSALGDAFKAAGAAVDWLKDRIRDTKDLLSGLQDDADKAYTKAQQKEQDERIHQQVTGAAIKKWSETHDVDVKELDDENQKAFEALGKNAGKSMAAGMHSTKADVHAAGKEIGAAAHEGAKAGADAHSPSRKMMALGEDLNEGLALGVEASLDRSTAAIAAAVQPPSISIGSGSGSRNVEVTIEHISITGGDVHEIRSMLESELADVLERAANEAGA